MDKTKLLLKLGNKIRYERLKRQLSQEKLAELAEMSMRSISLLECGYNNVQYFSLAKIAEAFEMNISELTDFRL
ncbi:MAG: helix-turn-helix transcriptional regulator [Candidatus Gastranaerophilales bacterium]